MMRREPSERRWMARIGRARTHALVAAISLVAAACGGVSGEGDDAPPPGAIRAASTIATGYDSSCALDADGRAWCWGDNYYGQLGDGTSKARRSPRAVVMPEGVTFSTIAAAGWGACALDTSGAAWCWGMSEDPWTGADDVSQIPVAVAMPPDTAFSSISVGPGGACALSADDGAAWCWGSMGYDPLVDGSSIESSEPIRVAVPQDVVLAAIAVGGGHICALDADGAAWCWGVWHDAEAFGQPPETDATPVAVGMPDGVSFTTLSAGARHTCAIDAQGAAWCWGWAATGSTLGVESWNAVSSAQAIQIESEVTFKTLSAGAEGTCALSTDDGTAWCWGEFDPVLGFGATLEWPIRPAPQTMPSDVEFREISLEVTHACAAATDGTFWCWGGNYFGQVGDGTSEDRSTPTQVAPFAAEAIAAPGDLEPAYERVTGEIPIWALTLEETRDLYVTWTSSLDTEWLESVGLPAGCAGQGSAPSEPFEACFGRYLEDNGVSSEAVRFAGLTEIAVFGMAGDGPVRVLWGARLADILTTGRSSDHFIVTPQGIMDFHGWIGWTRALSDAYVTDAYAASTQAAGSPEYWSFGVRNIGAPEQTDGGWSVPVAACLYGDKPCGRGEFAGRFVIDFTEDGDPLGARYLDMCRDDGLPTTIEERRRSGLAVDQLEGLLETLPECPDFGPWDLLG